jgi:phosphoglycolate phosphatase-like HAD superfamily hydrolase
MSFEAVIFDVDGTLVDSNYEHVLAWVRAFRANDVDVPAWVIHRHIGMGGDQLVAAVAGDEVEERLGDAIRDVESEAYRDYLPHVTPFPGADAVLQRCVDLDLTVVMASSAKPHELERYQELVGGAADAWTGSGDVENTKPEPDLIEVALDRAGTRSALMVGDATWDVLAAERAGLPTVGLLTGGFGEDELRSAGAMLVLPSLEALSEQLPSLLDADAPAA